MDQEPPPSPTTPPIKATSKSPFVSSTQQKNSPNNQNSLKVFTKEKKWNRSIKKCFAFFFVFLPFVILVFLVIFTKKAIYLPFWYHETRRTVEQGLNYEWCGDNWEGMNKTPKEEFQLDYEDIEFEGPENSTLRGWYIPVKGIPTKNAGVIGVHGAGGDRRDFLKFVPFFHSEGFPVLLFDCRDHGISSGDFDGPTFGVKEQEDILFAVKFFKEKAKVKQIILIGTSQGATSIILASSRNTKDIALIIAENPFSSLYQMFFDVISGALKYKPKWAKGSGIANYIATYGTFLPPFLVDIIARAIYFQVNCYEYCNAIDVIQNVTQPLFLIHGEEDIMIPPHHSRSLFQNANEPKDFWLVQGAKHSKIWNIQREEYKKRLKEFIDKYLKDM